MQSPVLWQERLVCSSFFTVVLEHGGKFWFPQEIIVIRFDYQIYKKFKTTKALKMFPSIRLCIKCKGKVKEGDFT